MRETKVQIDVIFKKDKETGELTGFFPNEIADLNYNIACYAHLGQHSAASIEYMNECIKATPKEYADLAIELNTIGYDLNILS